MKKVDSIQDLNQILTTQKIWEFYDAIEDMEITNEQRDCMLYDFITENHDALMDELSQDDTINEALGKKGKFSSRDKQRSSDQVKADLEYEPPVYIDQPSEPAPANKSNSSSWAESDKLVIDNDNIYNTIDQILKKIENTETRTVLVTDDNGDPVYDENGDQKTKVILARNLRKHTPLGDLDTHLVTDFSGCLAFSNIPNADLSSWDTSNAKDMEGMFYKANFNNPSICKWNVSSCQNFTNMFLLSTFDHDISDWIPGVKNGVQVKLPEVGQDSVESKERSIKKKLSAKFHVDDDDLYDLKYPDDMSESMNNIKKERSHKTTLSHIQSRDQFVNEKFGDTLKKAVGYISSKINQYYLALCDKFGKLMNAVSPITSVNYVASGNVPGVTAASTMADKNADVLTYIPEPAPTDEYYEILKPGDIEYTRYYESVGGVSEARVGLSAVSGGLQDPKDIDSETLTELLIDGIENPTGSSILVWGAPGIGKTTIPKAIIRALNEGIKDSKKKKSVLVADCGQMKSDGFSIPLPNKKSISVKGKSIELSASTDAPKTWLPMYKPTGDPETDKILNDFANGCVNPIYDERGVITGYEDRGDGGILMFDEFLRADDDIYKVMMNLCEGRDILGGYVLGDKWMIMACSNRPLDDAEVKRSFSGISPAALTRFEQYNFIPSYSEWKKWAVKQNIFEPVVFDFLQSKKENGEYIYWHNIDPDAKVQKGASAFATPRTWTKAFDRLDQLKKSRGVSSFTELPSVRVESILSGLLGRDVTTAFMDYVKSYDKSADSKLDVEDIVKNPKIKSAVTAAEAASLIKSYIESEYSKTRTPEPKVLDNIAQWLVNNYNESNSNFIWPMALEIVDYLGIDDQLGDEDFIGQPNWDKYSKFNDIISKFEI